MSYPLSIRAMAVAGALNAAITGAHAFDETKYPDFAAYWVRIGAGSFDPSKPPGRGQQAPLTEEYQAILDASLADQAAGGQGNNPMGRCIPPGLPRTMINYEGMEIVVTAKVTYILLLEPMDQIRRIFTDGRAWPSTLIPSYLGYSIGNWVDEDGDGRYDALLVETRGLKTTRSYDSSGAPFHKDGQAVVKERLSLDKSDPNVLQDEITTIDHALTRPWTVTRKYRRDPKAIWVETVCAEDNHQLRIGQQDYYIGADDNLLPTKKNQPAPDLKFFTQSGR
jgi:hypothetical protein